MNNKDKIKDAINRRQRQHDTIIPDGPAAGAEDTTKRRSKTVQNNEPKNGTEKLNSFTEQSNGSVNVTEKVKRNRKPKNTNPAVDSGQSSPWDEITEQTNGTDKLNSLTKPEQDSVTDNRNIEQEQGTTKENRKNEPEDVQLNGSGNHNLETEQGTGEENVNQQPVQGITSGFMQKFSTKRPTVEQTHTRDTFLIENDLLNRLNRIAERMPKGFKKELVNDLLRQAVAEIEGQQGGGDLDE